MCEQFTIATKFDLISFQIWSHLLSLLLEFCISSDFFDVNWNHLTQSYWYGFVSSNRLNSFKYGSFHLTVMIDRNAFEMQNTRLVVSVKKKRNFQEYNPVYVRCSSLCIQCFFLSSLSNVKKNRLRHFALLQMCIFFLKQKSDSNLFSRS